MKKLTYAQKQLIAYMRQGELAMETDDFAADVFGSEGHLFSLQNLNTIPKFMKLGLIKVSQREGRTIYFKLTTLGKQITI